MTDALSRKLYITTLNTEIAKKADLSNVMLLDGTRAMTGDLNMNSKSITNLKDPQAHDSYNATTVKYTNKTISDNNAFMKTNYENYVNNNLNHSISKSVDEEAKRLISYSYNDIGYIMASLGQFTDEDEITGKQFTIKFGSKVKPFELKLDTKKGYYSSRFGVNMYSAQQSEYTIGCETYWQSDKLDYNSVSLHVTKLQFT